MINIKHRTTSRVPCNMLGVVPIMTSNKQLHANQANATKSTGPRSQGGKLRSRLNSRKHGLTAKMLIIVGENADGKHLGSPYPIQISPTPRASRWDPRSGGLEAGGLRDGPLDHAFVVAWLAEKAKSGSTDRDARFRTWLYGEQVKDRVDRAIRVESLPRSRTWRASQRRLNRSALVLHSGH